MHVNSRLQAKLYGGDDCDCESLESLELYSVLLCLCWLDDLRSLLVLCVEEVVYSRRSRLLECCGVIVVWLLGVCGGGSIGSMIDGKLAARSCVKSSGVDGMSGGAVVIGIGCCGYRLYTVSIGAV